MSLPLNLYLSGLTGRFARYPLLAWLAPFNSYLKVHRLDKPIVVRVPVVLFQRWYKFKVEVSDDSGDKLRHFEHGHMPTNAGSRAQSELEKTRVNDEFA